MTKLTNQEKQRQLEIEYNSFINDVNEYSYKRLKEANERLKKMDIEFEINYEFEDDYNSSIFKKIFKFLKRLF